MVAEVAVEKGVADSLNGITGHGKSLIKFEEPYIAEIGLEGVSPLIFHAWDCDSIETKSKSAKNSEAKKTDDVESYVRRNERGEICIPGDYITGTIVNAARYLQDPRSPRKSAMDLFKAGIAPTEDLFSLGKHTAKTKDRPGWDYIDRRRVVVQRAGITRQRPALMKGWKISVAVMVLTPEYIGKDLLHDAITRAGRLIGLADHRPVFGRFIITSYKTSKV